MCFLRLFRSASRVEKLNGLQTLQLFNRSTDYAGIAQLVERQPSKLDVAGSNPVSRFKRSLHDAGLREGVSCKAAARRVTEAY